METVEVSLTPEAVAERIADLNAAIARIGNLDELALAPNVRTRKQQERAVLLARRMALHTDQQMAANLRVRIAEDAPWFDGLTSVVSELDAARTDALAASDDERASALGLVLDVARGFASEGQPLNRPVRPSLAERLMARGLAWPGRGPLNRVAARMEERRAALADVEQRLADELARPMSV
jgi:hypothetical protein